MKTALTIIFAFGLCLAISNLQAQSGTAAAGGQASGSGGTVSYTIGLVNYITVQSAEGKITQGHQQPYEIFVYSGIDDPGIQLIGKVYPNPTPAEFTLRIENIELSGLNFSLFDQLGQVIENGEINDVETTLNIHSLAEATYYLRVSRKDKEVKTFKIIKNQ